MSTLSSIPAQLAFADSDLDNDGISDDMDKCPNLQEDYENELDGCPSNFVPWYDEDFDGIEDHIDACPNIKENYNKFQDEDAALTLHLKQEEKDSLIPTVMVFTI